MVGCPPPGTASHCTKVHCSRAGLLYFNSTLVSDGNLEKMDVGLHGRLYQRLFTRGLLYFNFFFLTEKWRALLRLLKKCKKNIIPQELLRSHVEQLEDSKTRAADVKSVHENYESLEEEKEALLLQVATLQERCAGLEASTVGQMSGEEYDRLEQRARELAMTVTLQKEAAEQCATSTDVLLDLLTAYEEELAELHADLEQHTPHTPTDNDSTVVERLLRESREKGATAATLQIRLTAANKELAQKTAKCDELRESSADLQKRVVMLEKHLGESSGVYDRGYLEGLSALCERKNGVVAGLLDEVHRRDTLLSDAHEFMQRRSAALAAARTLNSLHPQEATHDLNELREESRALRVQLRKSQIKESKTHHEPQGDGTMGDKIDKLVAELEKREHMMCQRDALIHSLQNKLATTEFDKPMENVVSGLQVEVRQGQRSLRIKERHLGYAQRRCEQLVALVNHDVRDGAGAAAREEDLLKALGEAEERLKEQDVMLVNIQHAQEIAANSLAKVTTEHEALRLSSEGEQRRRHEAEHDMVSLTDTLKAAQLNIDGLRQQLEDQEEQTGSDTGGTTLSQIKDENKVCHGFGWSTDDAPRCTAMRRLFVEVKVRLTHTHHRTGASGAPQPADRYNECNDLCRADAARGAGPAPPCLGGGAAGMPLQLLLQWWKKAAARLNGVLPLVFHFLLPLFLFFSSSSSALSVVLIVPRIECHRILSSASA